MLDEVKKIKTLTVNGTKYKLRGSVEILSCGDLAVSADSDGIADITNMFTSLNAILSSTIATNSEVSGKISDPGERSAGKALVVDEDGESLTWGNVATDVSYKADSRALANTWLSSTAYQLDQHVTYQGMSYKCISAHTSESEFQQDYWQESQTYDDPDYQMLYDGNTMHIQDNAATSNVVWADEYKKDLSSSSTAITLDRNGIKWLDLSDNTTASTAVDVTLPTGGLTDYAKDMLLYVVAPKTVGGSTTSFMPINFTTTKALSWLGTDPFANLSSSTDLGKTFLFTFTELPNDTLLVSRNEVKGKPVVTTSSIGHAASQTLAGRYLKGVTAIAYTTDSWSTEGSLTFTVSNDLEVVVDASGLAASTTYTVRVTTANGAWTGEITTTA